MSVVFAGIVGLLGVSQAAGEPVCRPDLSFKQVRFSEMQPPTFQRKWSALVAVDASRCTANSSGYFEIAFRRLKEIGVEIEFREEFIWMEFQWSPSVKVEVDFWADEAVERYWIENVTPCPCRG
jgi:hypothetical protein